MRTQLERIGALAGLNGGSSPDLLGQLEGYGSMDLLGIGIFRNEAHRTNATLMIQGVVSARQKTANEIAKRIGEA
jgi:hypothetical protein